ncbi:TIGR00341 family protein [Halomicrococcus sp. NG-SE-24]|uniref:TIGR00341 family protein n=1 Tax=Halomicrococcus sp. NG-SE-24 TaxID=3436928 RepID=UPI003D96E112
MRLVEISVPIGEQEAVINTLEDEEIDYYLTDETSARRGTEDYAAIVTFPLPRNAVEPIIDDLRDAGLSQDAHVIISDVEVDLSRRFERLMKRYAKESSWQIRISREEILIRARELSPGLQTFLVLTVISAVVATAGLLLDSAAVVVGAMVIAPLVGPALSASVGTILDDPAMFRRGVWLQFVGVVLSIASAAAFTLLIRLVPLFPPGRDITRIAEVSGRISPDILSLIIALGAGAAGILSLSSGVSAALVGVMIAAALIPPAAAAGISIAWGEPFAAISASVLVLVNVLAINLSALVTLRYIGYRPKNWFKLEHSRSTTTKRVVVLLVLIALLSVFLGGITLSSVQDAQFERNVRTITDETLDQPQYEGIERIEMDFFYVGTSLLLPQEVRPLDFPAHQPRRVVVTVGTPSDRSYPALAEQLRTRIRSTTGHDVSIQVRYVEIDEAG